jgi:hypothetical protein
VEFLNVEIMGNKRNQLLGKMIHYLMTAAIKALTSIKLALLCGRGMYLH